MRPMTPNNEFWLDYNGQTVVVDGIEYLINAQALLSHPMQIDVSAEYVDKSLPSYRRIREQLGDDWSVDLLSSEIETTTAFQLALEAKTHWCLCAHCGALIKNSAVWRTTEAGILKFHVHCARIETASGYINQAR